MYKRFTKTVKLTEAEVEFVNAVAKERGLTFSEVVRDLIAQARMTGFTAQPKTKTVNWLAEL